MLNVAVVDDLEKDRKELISAINYLKEVKNIDSSIFEFEDAQKFLFSYNHQFDIVFLDVEMPGMDGFDLAREIRKIDEEVIIVFVTNLASMAIYGYEVNALNYLVKPINKEAFILTMSKAYSRISINKENTILLTNPKGEKNAISINKILYIEKDEHYVIYHTLEQDYFEYTTLAKVESKIKTTIFAYCSRSILVNIALISGITHNECLIFSKKVSIARTKKQEFLKKYSEFLGGKTK